MCRHPHLMLRNTGDYRPHDTDPTSHLGTRQGDAIARARPVTLVTGSLLPTRDSTDPSRGTRNHHEAR